jgi:hypothetical protein
VLVVVVVVVDPFEERLDIDSEVHERPPLCLTQLNPIPELFLSLLLLLLVAVVTVRMQSRLQPSLRAESTQRARSRGRVGFGGARRVVRGGERTLEGGRVAEEDGRATSRVDGWLRRRGFGQDE